MIVWRKKISMAVLGGGQFGVGPQLVGDFSEIGFKLVEVGSGHGLVSFYWDLRAANFFSMDSLVFRLARVSSATW